MNHNLLSYLLFLRGKRKARELRASLPTSATA